MPLVKKNIIRNIFKSPFLHRIWQLLNFREHATSLRTPKNLSNLLILLISYLHFVRTFIALFNSIYTWIWYVCKKLGKEPVRSQMTHYRFTNFCCFHKIFKFFLNLDEEENLLNLEQSRKFIFCWKVCLHLFLKWLYLSISEQPSNQTTWPISFLVVRFWVNAMVIPRSAFKAPKWPLEPLYVSLVYSYCV